MSELDDEPVTTIGDYLTSLDKRLNKLFFCVNIFPLSIFLTHNTFTVAVIRYADVWLPLFV